MFGLLRLTHTLHRNTKAAKANKQTKKDILKYAINQQIKIN